MPDGQESFVWFHAHPECRWRRRSPRKLSRRPNYYSRVDHDGAVRHDVEDYLQRVEDEAAVAIRNIVAPGTELDQASRRALANFIACMSMRTPRLHDEVEPGLSDVLMQHARSKWKEIRSNSAVLEDFRRGFAAQFGPDLDPIQVLGDALDRLKFSGSVDRGFLIRVVMSSTSRLADSIVDMRWHLLRAQESDVFVTSDFPVSQWDPATPDANFQAGLARKGVQLTFPLTRHIAVLATWDGQGTLCATAKSTLVAEINMRTIRLSSTIYASTPRFTGWEAIGVRGSDRGIGEG